MRELTLQEVDDVNGGLVPALIFVGAYVASQVTWAGVATAVGFGLGVGAVVITQK